MADENVLCDSVRTRLIFAGIRELETHDPSDFSLRRVAQMAQVSCAAPYRHFRDREDLIRQIFEYIRGQWQFFYRQVVSAAEGDGRAALLDGGVAYLLFWLGNPMFRPLLFSSESGTGSEDPLGFDADSEAIFSRVGAALGWPDERRREACTEYLVGIYGILNLSMRRRLRCERADLRLSLSALVRRVLGE